MFVFSAQRSFYVSMPRADLQQLQDHEGNIFATTIHDQYVAHPQNIENVTLASFATSFTTSYETPANETQTSKSDVDDNDDERNNTETFLGISSAARSDVGNTPKDYAHITHGRQERSESNCTMVLAL